MTEMTDSLRPVPGGRSSMHHAPVRLLWTPDILGFSESAHLGLAAAEEICLRNQVPFGYALSTEEHPLDVPDGCEVIVVANQVCLSDAQIDALVAYAKRGGRLVITGDSGRYDEWNAQRLENPLLPQLAGLPNVVLREKPDMLPSASLGWMYRVTAPKDEGTALMTDLEKAGYNPPFRVKNAPPHVFAELKRMEKGFALFLLNYNPDVEVRDASVQIPSGRQIRFESVLDAVPASSALVPASDGSVSLPPFKRAGSSPRFPDASRRSLSSSRRTMSMPPWRPSIPFAAEPY